MKVRLQASHLRNFRQIQVSNWFILNFIYFRKELEEKVKNYKDKIEFMKEDEIKLK